MSRSPSPIPNPVDGTRDFYGQEVLEEQIAAGEEGHFIPASDTTAAHYAALQNSRHNTSILQNQTRMLKNMVGELNRNSVCNNNQENDNFKINHETAMQKARNRQKVVERTVANLQMSDELHFQLNERAVATEQLEQRHYELVEKHCVLQGDVERNKVDFERKNVEINQKHDDFRKAADTQFIDLREKFVDVDERVKKGHDEHGEFKTKIDIEVVQLDNNLRSLKNLHEDFFELSESRHEQNLKRCADHSRKQDDLERSHVDMGKNHATHYDSLNKKIEDASNNVEIGLRGMNEKHINMARRFEDHCDATTSRLQGLDEEVSNVNENLLKKQKDIEKKLVNDVSVLEVSIQTSREEFTSQNKNLDQKHEAMHEMLKVNINDARRQVEDQISVMEGKHSEIVKSQTNLEVELKENISDLASAHRDHEVKHQSLYRAHDETKHMVDLRIKDVNSVIETTTKAWDLKHVGLKRAADEAYNAHNVKHDELVKLTTGQFVDVNRRRDELAVEFSTKHKELYESQQAIKTLHEEDNQALDQRLTEQFEAHHELVRRQAEDQSNLDLKIQDATSNFEKGQQHVLEKNEEMSRTIHLKVKDCQNATEFASRHYEQRHAEIERKQDEAVKRADGQIKVVTMNIEQNAKNIEIKLEEVARDSAQKLSSVHTDLTTSQRALEGRLSEADRKQTDVVQALEAKCMTNLDALGLSLRGLNQRHEKSSADLGRKLKENLTHADQNHTALEVKVDDLFSKHEDFESKTRDTQNLLESQLHDHQQKLFHYNRQAHEDIKNVESFARSSHSSLQTSHETLAASHTDHTQLVRRQKEQTDNRFHEHLLHVDGVKDELERKNIELREAMNDKFKSAVTSVENLSKNNDARHIQTCEKYDAQIKLQSVNLDALRADNDERHLQHCVKVDDKFSLLNANLIDFNNEAKKTIAAVDERHTLNNSKHVSGLAEMNKKHNVFAEAIKTKVSDQRKDIDHVRRTAEDELASLFRQMNLMEADIKENHNLIQGKLLEQHAKQCDAETQQQARHQENVRKIDKTEQDHAAAKAEIHEKLNGISSTVEKRVHDFIKSTTEEYTTASKNFEKKSHEFGDHIQGLLVKSTHLTDKVDQAKLHLDEHDAKNNEFHVRIVSLESGMNEQVIKFDEFVEATHKKDKQDFINLDKRFAEVRKTTDQIKHDIRDNAEEDQRRMQEQATALELKGNEMAKSLERRQIAGEQKLEDRLYKMKDQTEKRQKESEQRLDQQVSDVHRSLDVKSGDLERTVATHRAELDRAVEAVAAEMGSRVDEVNAICKMVEKTAKDELKEREKETGRLGRKMAAAHEKLTDRVTSLDQNMRVPLATLLDKVEQEHARTADIMAQIDGFKNQSSNAEQVLNQVKVRQDELREYLADKTSTSDFHAVIEQLGKLETRVGKCIDEHGQLYRHMQIMSPRSPRPHGASDPLDPAMYPAPVNFAALQKLEERMSNHHQEMQNEIFSKIRDSSKTAENALMLLANRVEEESGRADSHVKDYNMRFDEVKNMLVKQRDESNQLQSNCESTFSELRRNLEDRAGELNALLKRFSQEHQDSFDREHQHRQTLSENLLSKHEALSTEFKNFDSSVTSLTTRCTRFEKTVEELHGHVYKVTREQQESSKQTNDTFFKEMQTLREQMNDMKEKAEDRERENKNLSLQVMQMKDTITDLQNRETINNRKLLEMQDTVGKLGHDSQDMLQDIAGGLKNAACRVARLEREQGDCGQRLRLGGQMKPGRATASKSGFRF